MKWFTRTKEPRSATGTAPAPSDERSERGDDRASSIAAETSVGAPAVAGTERHREPPVRLRQVSKRFGNLTALAPLTLDVGAGELFGLVGPSGCGKTTLVRLIAGLLLPTQGDVTIRGVPPRAFGVDDRRSIGYLPQEFSLHPTLTIGENVRFVASLYGLGWFERRQRIREVLEFLEIWEIRRRLAGNASGGQRRRLSLAAALLHRPSVLVVDEPTAGLDPALRARIWEYLHEIQRHGTTIFLTTQYIEEIGECNRVAVLNDGRLIANGTPDEIRDLAGIPDTVVVDVAGISHSDVQRLRALPAVLDVWHIGGEQLRVRATHGDQVAAVISRDLEQHGRLVRSIEVERARFDEVFMRLVERGS